MSDQKINVLIVEDEWITSEEIKEVLEEKQINVTGQVDNAEEALEIVQNETIDVAILDINIKGDNDGIWLASQINKIRTTAIIFLTAFEDDEYVERAKKVVPAAYMVKPFQAKNLIISVEMAFSSLLQDRESEEQLPSEFILADRIFIKENQLLKKILLEDILYVEAVGSYSKIHTKKSNHTLAINLKTFSSKLSHDSFVRVHRSYLVNSTQIDAINGNIIYLQEASIPIGAAQRSEVLKRLRVI
ncbi:LytR/AlgR family response regulator transcription factor [Ekhidna sp.]|uniref:LytR/AlgR family response regulator transcription factor n=1 Tax=Ekhidna sp. TaxID=2608089 RepID=UPI003CCC388E